MVTKFKKIRLKINKKKLPRNLNILVQLCKNKQINDIMTKAHNTIAKIKRTQIKIKLVNVNTFITMTYTLKILFNFNKSTSYVKPLYITLL